MTPLCANKGPRRLHELQSYGLYLDPKSTYNNALIFENRTQRPYLVRYFSCSGWAIFWVDIGFHIGIM